MSRFGVFKINGVQYDLDDLTLDEVEGIEELGGGQPFSELNFGSAKTMKAIAFTLMKRSNPALEMSEVGAVKVIDFMAADEEMPALPPEEEGESQNGSELAGSGTPPSVVSIAG